MRCASENNHDWGQFIHTMSKQQQTSGRIRNSLFLSGGFSIIPSQSISLLKDSVLSSLTSSLGLETTSLHLILKKLGTLCPIKTG